jgi:hypothetical protein
VSGEGDGHERLDEEVSESDGTIEEEQLRSGRESDLIGCAGG